MTKELNKNGKFTPIDVFVERAKKVHGEKYDYSKVKYRTLKDKVIIICPVHGEFNQTPKLHVKQGCKQCGIDKRAAQKRFSLAAFIEKATNVHSNKYDYSQVVYKNGALNVDIICKVHGPFSQIANSHVQGQGCPKCGLLSQVTSRLHHGCWKYSDWEQAGAVSKHFVGFQLYVIRCWNNDEEFIKVGKTFISIAKRFYTKLQMPYNYQIIEHRFGTAREISKAEKEIHANFKSLKYVPSTHFNGKQECFSIAALPKLLTTLKA